MSSLAKNTDTLFERTFAESLNLHLRYPDVVLGEVYLIPIHEYDEQSVEQNKVFFSSRQTNLEKYISFFNAINNRLASGPAYAYERCSLLIVDFNQSQPKLYKNSEELKDDGFIPNDFDIEYESLNFQNFAKDILEVYKERFNINNIIN